jgi:hypothetical protein
LSELLTGVLDAPAGPDLAATDRRDLRRAG